MGDITSQTEKANRSLGIDQKRTKSLSKGTIPLGVKIRHTISNQSGTQ